tara:strand:- start:675 stop:1310 length:636 start_codon:yes stop_codon:yes gene_type:complete
MTEALEVYDLDEKFLRQMDRDKFYAEIMEEFKKTGKVSKKVKSIRAILMNSDGRIYVQKRSSKKMYNAGLYDKTIGGHVVVNHTYRLTLIKEFAEELGFPVALLDDEEFEPAVKSTDLRVVGVFRQIDHLSDYLSVRKSPKGDMEQPFITSFYIGYYDGSIRFCDGEASGVELFTLEELKEDIENSPNKYTEDLKFMINHYSKELIPASQL